MGGAHRDPAAAIAATGRAISDALKSLQGMSPDELRDARAEKFSLWDGKSSGFAGPRPSPVPLSRLLSADPRSRPRPQTGVAPNPATGANSKRTWRQTQIHANFSQSLPIAVLSLFKGLPTLQERFRPLPPPAHLRVNTYDGRFIQKALQTPPNPRRASRGHAFVFGPVRPCRVNSDFRKAEGNFFCGVWLIPAWPSSRRFDRARLGVFWNNSRCRT